MENYSFGRNMENCRVYFHGIDELRDWDDRNNYTHFAILKEVFDFMKQRGFKVGIDKSVDKMIRRNYFIGRKGDLEFKASRYPAGFCLEFYQNIVIKNPNGGEYDFDKLEKMPYLIRLSFINETNKIMAFLKTKGAIDVTEPVYRLAEDCIKKHYVDSRHHDIEDMNFNLSDLDGKANVANYNGKDRDGKLMENGEIKYFRAGDGRLRRCKVYHNINNMWWCILNDTEYANIGSFHLFDASEEDFKTRRKVRNRRPLLQAKTPYGQQLVDVWAALSVEDFKKIFVKYMRDLGVPKSTRKNYGTCDIYLADTKATCGNRVDCLYKKKEQTYGGAELDLTLRKQAGNYLVIEHRGKRIFEVSYGEVYRYEEDLLVNIIEEHRPLFDSLFKKARKLKAS